MLKEAIQGFTISPQQRDLWLLLPEAGGALYSVQCALLVPGDTDAGLLAAALADLVERHEALRTTFHRLPGMSLPVQVVTPATSPEIRTIDRSAATTPRRQRIADLLRETRGRRWDLEQGPVLDAVLARLEDGESALVLTLPALCADAPSVAILARDLRALYTARAAGAEPPEPVLQYADVAEWQNQLLEEPEAELGREHWLGRQAPACADPGLPFMVRRPGAEMEPAWVEPDLGPGGAERLGAAAAALGAPLELVLLACWQALLARLTGHLDLAVGVASDGRRYEDLAGVAGPLTRYLPVRSGAGQASRPSELVTALQEELRDARARQEYFAWEDAAAPEGAGGGRRFPALCFDFEGGDPGATGSAPFAILDSWSCSERSLLRLSAALRQGALALRLHYDARCFDRADVEVLGGQYLELLRGVAVDPERPLAELELLSEPERRELVAELNRTERAFPGERCLHELFVEQARRSPEAAALTWNGGSMSFGDLERRVHGLAHRLRSRGVGAETRVGLLLERSPEMVVALLAVLEAGGAYVPLEPSHPAERLAWMVEDGGLRLVLTRERLAGRLPAGVERLLLEGEETAAETGPPSVSLPEHLAYVLYTSGSTGRPKGVMVPHRGVVNYVTWAREHYAADAGSGAPVHSPLSFDLTVTSLLVPLLSGRRVLLLAEEEGVEALGRALRREEGFSLVKLTPAHLRILAQELPGASLAGRTGALVVGGEALSWDSLVPWRAHAPGTRLINEYGPTETVVGCCVYEARQEGTGAVPIGRPIGNTQVYVLDEGLRPVARWMTGELYVGGAGLARGYLGRPERTAESFVPNPFGAPGSRLYRTGDLGRFRSDGNLEFLGRRDHQVKVRGYRIEPGEVEQALLSHPRVSEAAVGVRDDAAGERRLVAWVVGGDGGAPGIEELRRHLAERLPEPMIPSAWVTLEALPLTANGKVDRAALPPPGEGRPDLEQVYVAPRTAVEEILADTWATILGLERVGVHDSFFSLGGDSMRSVQAVALLRQRGLEIELQDLFRHPTVEALGRRIEEALGAAGSPAEGEGEDLDALLAQLEGLSDEEAREALLSQTLPAAAGGVK